MMAFLFRPVRLLPVIRQLALVAMLLVQATIVASPLFEPHSTGAPVTHVEEPGTRHVDMHNEETCVVCSVRAMSSCGLVSSAVAIAWRRDSRTVSGARFAERLCADDVPATVASAYTIRSFCIRTQV
jgi:hypothetical protein